MSGNHSKPYDLCLKKIYDSWKFSKCLSLLLELLEWQYLTVCHSYISLHRNLKFLVLVGPHSAIQPFAGIILQIWNREKPWLFSIIFKRSDSLFEHSFYILYVPELEKGRNGTVLGKHFSHVPLWWSLRSATLWHKLPWATLAFRSPWRNYFTPVFFCAANIWNPVISNMHRHNPPTLSGTNSHLGRVEPQRFISCAQRKLIGQNWVDSKIGIYL